MNRRQEIAAWIFGLLIALGLFATDKEIWALAVLAVLTVISLRDRQRKKATQKNPDNPAQAPAAASDKDETLKNITPHVLAAIILQNRAEGELPFEEWRKADANIPKEAEATVALMCQFLQIWILLECIERRFGHGIAMLVAGSFSTILDSNPLGPRMFANVASALQNARALGPVEEGPKDPQLRLDMRLADQILSFIAEPEESKAQVRLGLAQCLSLSRISAEALFSDLVGKIDFEPLSIALVQRKDTDSSAATAASE